MDYKLGVQLDEYHHWRNLLDDFILTRQSEAASHRGRNSWAPTFSPQTTLYTPSATIIPSVPIDTTYRARSASPQKWDPRYAFGTSYAFPATPGAARKRTAVDAFANHISPTTSVDEQMRLPARKVASGQSMTPTYAAQFSNAEGRRGRPRSFHEESSLDRVPSVNRQIARMPGSGSGSRRGSAGQIFSVTPELDLRHTATTHAQIQEWSHRDIHGDGNEWGVYRALVAPYEAPSQPQPVPPEVSHHRMSSNFANLTIASHVLLPRSRSTSRARRSTTQGDSSLPRPGSSLLLSSSTSTISR